MKIKDRFAVHVILSMSTGIPKKKIEIKKGKNYTSWTHTFYIQVIHNHAWFTSWLPFNSCCMKLSSCDFNRFSLTRCQSWMQFSLSRQNKIVSNAEPAYTQFTVSIFLLICVNKNPKLWPLGGEGVMNICQLIIKNYIINAMILIFP